MTDGRGSSAERCGREKAGQHDQPSCGSGQRGGSARAVEAGDQGRTKVVGEWAQARTVPVSAMAAQGSMLRPWSGLSHVRREAREVPQVRMLICQRTTCRIGGSRHAESPRHGHGLVNGLSAIGLCRALCLY